MYMYYNNIYSQNEFLYFEQSSRDKLHFPKHFFILEMPKPMIHWVYLSNSHYITLRFNLGDNNHQVDWWIGWAIKLKVTTFWYKDRDSIFKRMNF